jgi:hypothetical protein
MLFTRCVLPDEDPVCEPSSGGFMLTRVGVVRVAADAALAGHHLKLVLEQDPSNGLFKVCLHEQ